MSSNDPVDRSKPVRRSLGESLLSNTPQVPQAQRPEGEHASEASSSGQEGTNPSIPDPNEHRIRHSDQPALYPEIDDGIFPLRLNDFMHDCKSLVIKYTNGTGDISVNHIKRTINRSTPTIFTIAWIHSKNHDSNGIVEISSRAKVEHRFWKQVGKTQYTIHGAGGTLWVDGDPVTFYMANGETWDLGMWLESRALQRRQSR